MTVQAKRVELARAIADAIGKEGAWVTSIPGADKHLRVEIREGSNLADRLAERYTLTRGGTSERLVHNAVKSTVKNAKGEEIRRTSGAGIVPVEVWFLELP